jgi:putative tryptophan/tyrosine transport system permease protein
MITSIIEQALIALPLLMGAYLTLSLLKLPDFSLESAYLFGAVAAFLVRDLPIPLVFCSAVIGGMVVGTTVSVLNQCFKIPFLIATIVTNGLFHGFSQYLLRTSVTSFQLSFPFHEMVVLTLVGIFLVGIMFLGMRSQLGYCLAIYGNNPLFFSNHPISGRYVVFVGVNIGHGLAGISGFLFAQSNGFVDLTMNFGLILLCLTALMVGKLIFRSIHPNILVPLAGVVAYFIIQQTLLRMGLDLKYFNSFQALSILGILFLGRKKQTFNLDHLGV